MLIFNNKAKITAKNGLRNQAIRLHLEELKENLGHFLNFKSVKSPESGKEKNRKSGIRTFKISRTTGTGRDVRLSPNLGYSCSWETTFLWPTLGRAVRYGNTGCQVFKQGVQTWNNVLLRINIPKGDY